MTEDNTEFTDFKKRVANLLRPMGYMFSEVRITVHGDDFDPQDIGPQAYMDNASDRTDVENVNHENALERLQTILNVLLRDVNKLKLPTYDPDYLELAKVQYQFYSMMQFGVEFPYGENQDKFDQVQLIDYLDIKNNTFRIVEGWMGVRLDGFYWDYIVMVNNLPVVGVVIKKTEEGNRPCEDAFFEMQCQLDDDRVFSTYVQMCIISDGTTTLYGSPSDAYEDFEPWGALCEEDKDLPPELATFAAVLRPETLLDILHNEVDTVPDDFDEEYAVKYVPKYEEYRAKVMKRKGGA